MRIRFQSALIGAWLALACLSAGVQAQADENTALPYNLIITEDARERSVWKRSPTFREQCRRIAQAQWLKIRFGFAVKNTSRYNGRTRVRRGPLGIE